MTPLVDRRSIGLLHFALLVGPVMIAAVFGLIFLIGDAPLIPAGEGASVIAMVLGLFTMLTLAVTWRFHFSRLRRRLPTESPEEFWRGGSVRQTAMQVWVMSLGGIIISLVGTLLTGSPITIVAAALGFGLLLMASPSRLERV